MDKSIDELRQEITQIDRELIALMARRQVVALQIGEYKRKHGLAVFDPEREAFLKGVHEQVCCENNLAPRVAARVFDVLIEESRKVQQ